MFKKKWSFISFCVFVFSSICYGMDRNKCVGRKGKVLQTQQALDGDFIYQVSQGNMANARSLLKDGARINAQRPNSGMTAVHWSVINQKLEALIFLIENKASVNIANDEGRTPLHLAAMRGNEVFIDILVGAGADVSSRDYNERKASTVAAFYGYKDIAKMLSGAEANLAE